MPIRAALFDLGDTLVSYFQPSQFMPLLRQSLEACRSSLGHALLGREEQLALLHQALELNQERADLAVWPLEERLRVLFSHDNPDPAQLEALCAAFLAPIFATARVNRDAFPVLSALKRRGIRTAIVSNTPWGSAGHTWRAELARHGLLDAVDATVFCRDVGWRKPHPAPFRRALEVLGVAAKEAVFVGDNPIWDIEGARGAGVRPVLLASRPHPLNPAQVSLASSLPEVLNRIDQWNASAPQGPQSLVIA